MSFQAEVAARNIVKLIRHDEDPVQPAPVLEEYVPGEPAIKLSLGLVSGGLWWPFVLLMPAHDVLQSQAVYQVQGVVGRKMGVSQDLDAPLMWKYYGLDPTEETMRL